MLATPSEAQSLVVQLQQKLQWSELQRSALEEQLRLRRIEKYGAGSEKLSNLQLELLEEEPSVSQADYRCANIFPPYYGLGQSPITAPTRPNTHGSGRPALLMIVK